MYVSIDGLVLSYLPGIVAVVSGLLVIFASSLLFVGRRNETGDSKDPDTVRSVVAPASILRKAIQNSVGDRRVVSDRRDWEPMPVPPFSDSTGVVVIRDRRQTPDRRIQSIRVEELDNTDELRLNNPLVSGSD